MDAYEVLDIRGLDHETLKYLKECKEKYAFNRVEVLIHMVQVLITQNMDDGILKIAPPILSRVYQTLSRGLVNLLNARKITDTRFPFPYAQLISILIFLYSIVTPVAISVLVKNLFLGGFLTFMVVFGMTSLNFIAIELEMPFGDDDNDLPLRHFQSEMNSSLLMLLHEKADHLAGTSLTSKRNFGELASNLQENRVTLLARSSTGGFGRTASDGQARGSIFSVVLEEVEEDSAEPVRSVPSSALRKSDEAVVTGQKTVPCPEPLPATIPEPPVLNFTSLERSLGDLASRCQQTIESLDVNMKETRRNTDALVQLLRSWQQPAAMRHSDGKTLSQVRLAPFLGPCITDTGGRGFPCETTSQPSAAATSRHPSSGRSPRNTS